MKTALVFIALALTASPQPSENYSEACIYWEIDRVDGNLTRQYELTASEIMQAEIYIEFENGSECVMVEVNPFTESITVID